MGTPEPTTAPEEVGLPAWAGGQPQLRLVASHDQLGPISPELVLVDPELARALRETVPVPFQGDRPRLVPAEPEQQTEETDERSGPPDRGSSRWGLFDTPDRSLRRHDVTLERRLVDGLPRWRLTLPLGEVVKANGAAHSDDPPAEIVALLRGVIGDEALAPVRWHSDSHDFARLQEYVLQELHSLLRHEPGTRLGTNPENLHQFRVAGRRLRAALKTGGRFLDAGWAASVKHELASLARFTGPLRDLDVMLERLEQEQVDAVDQEGLAALLADLHAQRSSLREKLLEQLDGPEYRGLLDRLGRPIEAAEDQPKHSLRRRTCRDLSGLVRDVRELGRKPKSKELHNVRLAVKRVRYSLELAGRPGSRTMTAVIDAARGLQEILGSYQDAVTAEERLRATAISAGNVSAALVAGSLIERQRQTRAKLTKELPAAWRQLRQTTRRRRR